MSNNQHELVQHCIDSAEFVTVKLSNHYLLFHENIIKHSTNQQLDLELCLNIIRRFFESNHLTIKNAQITKHVDSSSYDGIIFADKSIVYTRKRTSFDENEDKQENINETKILPYYVFEDLELLRGVGISNEDIDLFVEKLNANDSIELFNSDKYAKVIQRIIDYTDIPTRLKCRQVSHQWKIYVDNSSSWNRVTLSKDCRYMDRALSYFQNIDIRELDLSEVTFESSTFDLNSEFHLYSLRTLCISTDHPLELFTLLFKMAPFLQHIKLNQTYNSSVRFKNDNHLYDCINFVISQCQQRLKCLRRLHIQLQSASDQIYLESSSVTTVPISYEVVTC